MVQSADTSSLLSYRANIIVPDRLKLIKQSLLNKDFSTFSKITMLDSNQFHAICMDTYPPIFYLNDTSKNIAEIIHKYNECAGEIRASYTFDAGPNAILFTLEHHVVELCALLLKVFPSLQNKKYFNNESFASQVFQKTIGRNLLETIRKCFHGKSRLGNINKIILTRCGPGPRMLGDKDAVIDL